MWKLWNRLFGWHYVTLRSGSMDCRYTLRARPTKGGETYVEFAGKDIWFLLENGKVDNGYTWKALTF